MLDGKVSVGSVVRVPLGGRRVRGYVTSLRREDRPGLKDIAAVSGDMPVFDERLLETLRWASVHYVAPLAVVLAKAAPPNVPRRRVEPSELPGVAAPGPSVLAATSDAAAAGRHRRAVHLVGRPPAADLLAGILAPVLGAGRGALVVCPTLEEASRVHDGLAVHFPRRVALGASGLAAAQTTAAWTAAASTRGLVLIGTRETAFWPVRALGLAVVLGDGRRGMKDKQTPTTNVREVLRRRAAVEKFSLVLTGPVPTAEAVAAGVEIVGASGRPWPLIEVVDRGEEPPGSGYVTERCRIAVHAVLRRGGRVFLFAQRRGYAPAFRCVACRTVRRCGECGARPDRSDECSRCGAVLPACVECGGRRFEPLGAGVGRLVAELARSLGDAVGEAGSGVAVQVGTERDLVGLQPVDLAVVVDADGLMLAPHYRAEEDALRLMARVAQTVGSGRGRRCMVQTGLPDSSVIAALRRGDATELIAELVERRAADGFPPAGELIVLEVENEPDDASETLDRLVGGRGTVLGPAEVRDRRRWLIQGRDLRQVRIALRRLVQTWRDGGTRVRVDVDPEDL